MCVCNLHTQLHLKILKKNDATSHLTPLLWKSLASKYIIILKNVINEIMKKSDKTN